jgi:hypothetical protein
VYVEGKGGAMSEFQASFGASPDISIDTPSELFADPSDYGGGTFYARWRSLVLGYTDVDDTGFDHLVGVFANTTAYNASQEDRPRQGDEVNQWVTRNDTTAQTALAGYEGGDGIREYYVQDRRLSYNGAVARGDAELELFANPIVTVQYETQDPNARPGGEVTISLSSPLSVSGTYRIQSVNINDLELSTTQWPWRTVTASSVRFDLYDVLRRRERAA